MFKKIKEFFTRSPATEASWPFPTARAIDAPVIVPEPINAVPTPKPPPIVEQPTLKAPATKAVVKSTKASPKQPATKPITQNTTKRSPGRPSKKP